MARFALLILFLFTGCYHDRSVFGDRSNIQYVAPTRQEAIEFCLSREMSCHYDETKRVEVRR